MFICEFGKKARVYIKPDTETFAELAQTANASAVALTPSCCTGNQVLRPDLIADPDKRRIVPLEWKQEWVYRCAARFAEDTPLHQRTSSTHSAFLMRDGAIIFEAEDIGRHNAIDKAVGYAMIHGIDLAACCLFTSGRVPVDVMEKVVRAGIPVLISKEVPTAQAVAMADEYGVTLIGKARPESFELYLC
ncbi:MAG: formate dehydrogenase accessory sulfurtransferase FdhD [Mogibacterium sp.]|nr:formate dehydrogenase accessory sulfurtransferase FdhD [Mogibacterium sp.]